jgi:hypothetical protein
MKKRILIFFALTTLKFSAIAQIQPQIFAGHQAVEYNFLWFKDFDSTKRVTLFNFSFYNINYEDQSRNTYEIYQVATYNITSNWGLAGGGRFANGEFQPVLAVSYQLATSNLYFNIFPSIQYSSLTEQLNYSLFGLLFYKPRLSKTWRMFNQVAFEPFVSKQGHVFSYQQLRMGLEYKNGVQFGLGANLEQFGESFDSTYNIGLFIRKEL